MLNRAGCLLVFTAVARRQVNALPLELGRWGGSYLLKHYRGNGGFCQPLVGKSVETQASAQD